MARIFAVGIATLDTVNVVPFCPADNGDVRALAQRVARGALEQAVTAGCGLAGGTCGRMAFPGLADGA